MFDYVWDWPKKNQAIWGILSISYPRDIRHYRAFSTFFSNKAPPISYTGSLFNCPCSPTKYHGVRMEDFNVDFNTTGSRAQQATNFHIWGVVLQNLRAIPLKNVWGRRHFFTAPTTHIIWIRNHSTSLYRNLLLDPPYIFSWSSP